MDIALIVTFAGILVAGLAGVLGVWMERDPEAPPRWAFVFSGLIALAVTVELGHAVVQASEDGETEEAMARVLEQLADLADKGDNPALEQFVGAELAAQSRANPRMMKRMEARMAAKGKDPSQLRRRASEGRRKAAGLPAGKGGRKGGGAAKARGEGGDAPARTRPEGTERPEGAAKREGAERPEGAAKRDGAGRPDPTARPAGDAAEDGAEAPAAEAPARGAGGGGGRKGDKARTR